MFDFFATPWTVACQVRTCGQRCPQDFPGKNIGVGCRFLLQGASWPREQTHISVSPELARGFFSTEPPGKPPVCPSLDNRLCGHLEPTLPKEVSLKKWRTTMKWLSPHTHLLWSLALESLFTSVSTSYFLCNHLRAAQSFAEASLPRYCFIGPKPLY